MANPFMGSSSGTMEGTQRLEKNVLSVPNGIALAAAAMAPVIAVVLNAPAAGPVAGAALPLSFLLAFIACLLVGNSVVQFSRRLPSAGSFYTFNSYGLGKSAGFFTGWLFWIGYAILAPGLFTAFGAFAHDYFASTFNADIPWWIFSLIGMAVVVGLPIRSIKASVNIELKSIDGSANPYIALGGLIVCGLDGIRRQLNPGLPSEHDPGKMSEKDLERHHIRRLPTTMAGALNELEQDQLLMEAMGDLMRRSYLAVRRSEEKAFSEQDIDFEIRNHFYKF